ncbi:glycosyltransferase [Allocoleopsis franciscana]|uniref:Glycosyl transferase n=1 Tax=Allocoleopsis franciscana PCC 7113 TaxID=1173027 RepID=K9WKF6_9CYAN|nr:glycosyltransferase [Allocoleopsis franciscana]AFZ20658.1 glycosyl transferase [Allocoleopsis franciscana PCC 7113]
MPLISVIIPAYNAEKTIQETIDSVLNQTFQDFEIIVINDGSQDKTLEIVNSIKDPRLQVFSYPNAKQAASRNRGISHSTGEFLAFLDADDLWKPDKLEAQLKALQDNPEAVVAYSWSQCIDENGYFLREASQSTTSGDVYAKLLLCDFLDNGSNPLVRRQALEEVGTFDESLPPAEDWELWIRLAARYHFVAVPYPHILYRQSPTSASANLLRMASACKRVIDLSFERAPDSLQHLKSHSLANLYRFLAYRCFERFPTRSRALIALRFLWNAVINDSSLLRRKITWKMLLTSVLVLLLTHRYAYRVAHRTKQLHNFHTILSLMQLEPF